MRVPTLAEQGVFCITRPTYSLSKVVLVCFGFGCYFLIINFIALYRLSFNLWDLLFRQGLLVFGGPMFGIKFTMCARLRRDYSHAVSSSS